MFSLPSFKFLPLEEVDDALLNETWSRYRESYAMSYEDFVAALRRKVDRLCICRESGGGELLGFMGFRDRVFTLASGERVRAVNMSMTWYAPRARGKGISQVPPTLTAFDALVRHRELRTFGWVDALTVRPYLNAARVLREVYPHPDRDLPDDVRELRDLLGRTYYGEAYDASRGVVRKEKRVVTEPDIDPERLSDPLVAHYAELNPGYTRGDGMLVMMPATAMNALTAFGRIARWQVSNRFAPRPVEAAANVAVQPR